MSAAEPPPTTASPASPVGALVREWRRRRRLSQLELASRAGTSTRHLSYVENGRSAPSRVLLLHLAEHLDVPARERNQLLIAGGFAPVHSHHGLADPALEAARGALRGLLRAQQPFPALAVDRHWNLLDANEAVAVLREGCAPHLLEPPINVLRMSLHPDGMAPRIVNLADWHARVSRGLRRQAVTTGDPELSRLLDELAAYPHPAQDPGAPPDSIAVPLRYRYRDTVVDLISTTSVFGAPLDVTLAEIAVESFFPADEHTRRFLTERAGAHPEPGVAGAGLSEAAG